MARLSVDIGPGDFPLPKEEPLWECQDCCTLHDWRDLEKTDGKCRNADCGGDDLRRIA